MATQTENSNAITPGHHDSGEASLLHHQSKQLNFKDLDDEELQVLVTLVINMLHDRGLPYPTGVLQKYQIYLIKLSLNK
jgi:hypothetical protein